MASDFLGGLGGLGNLGGLMKGLTNFMPQDDPAVQLMNVQSEVGELQKQEAELYVEIGKKAVQAYGLEAFGESADRLRLVQSNLSAAKAKLSKANEEKAAREKAEKEAADALTCPSCGHSNPEGTKFCQECGAKLGAPKKSFCAECGAELEPGIRFCGECGARQA